jgi:secreted PhoX family phosphatase
MPDRVTSYGTDDGTAVMWLRFVSKEADKFDEGELFCAQLVQNVPCADVNVCQGYDEANPNHKDGTAAMFHASVSWLSMGTAKASDIKLALTDFNKTGAPIKFLDMFDVPKEKNPDDPYYGTIQKDTGFNMTDPALDSTATPKGAGFPCATGFKGISTGGKAVECLKIKKTREKWASRLETRRYAAMLGCSTEMEKWESTAFDPIGKVMYTTISRADKNLAAKTPSGNGKPQDLIRIPKTNFCGCVMETGFADDTYKTSYLKAHLCGSTAKPDLACNASYTKEMKDKVAADSSWGKNTDKFICDDFLYNQCNKSSIANPDGVTFMTEFNQLVIMEDSTEGHRNDYVWVQNGWDAKITRIFTTPLGAEATGAQWYPNLGPGGNGQFSYLGIVVQHPYDENDAGGKTSGFVPKKGDSNRGYVGVLGPLKKVDRYVSAASSFSSSIFFSSVSVVLVSLVAF